MAQLQCGVLQVSNKLMAEKEEEDMLTCISEQIPLVMMNSVFVKKHIFISNLRNNYLCNSKSILH